MATITAPLRGVLLVAIASYRWLISPLLGSRCRFWPSCSQYASEALKTLPLHQACWLIVRRLCRCHPLHPGGCEPLPTLSPREKHLC